MRVRHTGGMIGPHGEKRPGDTLANCTWPSWLWAKPRNYTDTEKRKGSKKGGEARAASLSPDARSQIAQVPAAARWNPPAE